MHRTNRRGKILQNELCHDMQKCVIPIEEMRYCNLYLVMVCVNVLIEKDETLVFFH